LTPASSVGQGQKSVWHFNLIVISNVGNKPGSDIHGCRVDKNAICVNWRRDFKIKRHKIAFSQGTYTPVVPSAISESHKKCI